MLLLLRSIIASLARARVEQRVQRGRERTGTVSDRDTRGKAVGGSSAKSGSRVSGEKQCSSIDTHTQAVRETYVAGSMAARHAHTDTSG